MPSVDEIWGHSVRNLNGDTVRVDQVVVATEARVAALQKEVDALKEMVDKLRAAAHDSTRIHTTPAAAAARRGARSRRSAPG